MSRRRGVVHKKEQKGRTRDKKGKPENIPKVLNAVGEHSLLERQLGIKEKHVSLKSDICSTNILSAYHVPGTMLGVGT